ncbi:MAG: DUF2092 domain-containing protein [Luteolibacter sp.]
MKTTISTIAICLALALAAALPAHAADQPNADTILKQMSDKLGAARQFSFKATRTIDSGLAAAKGVQANAKIEVTVKRPNHIYVFSSASKDVRRMYADGSKLTIYDGKESLYSSVPMKASLDAMPAFLAKKYSFEPPLVSFVVSSPYKDIHARGSKLTYAGTANVPSGFLGLGSTPCHRIGLSTKGSYAELWIATGDSLPRKLTVVPKGHETPWVTINFTSWNLAASVSDGMFTFTPPKDSYPIPMVTTDEMKSAKKK